MRTCDALLRADAHGARLPVRHYSITPLGRQVGRAGL
jgi:hypothetical protein